MAGILPSWVRLQFRLFTALLLVITGGAFVGLNVIPAEEFVTAGSDGPPVTPALVLDIDRMERPNNNWLFCFRQRVFGWPLPMCVVTDVVRPSQTTWQHDASHGDSVSSPYVKRALIADAIFGMILLLSAAVFSEWRLRHRVED
jgi:hypothetical protein